MSPGAWMMLGGAAVLTMPLWAPGNGGLEAVVPMAIVGGGLLVWGFVKVVS